MAEAPPARLGLRLCVHSMVALSIPGAAQMLPILADLLNSILNIDGKYDRALGEGARRGMGLKNEIDGRYLAGRGSRNQFWE